MHFVTDTLLTLLGLSILVIVHESGHYFAARSFGMRVLRYSIGLGPTLFKYQPKNSPTIFQVCAIPFLAYVQIDGMNPFEETKPDDPELFTNKGVFARAFTIFAGSFANYLAAAVMIFGIVTLDGLDKPLEETPMIVSTITEGSPAERAGVRLGDEIIKIGDANIANVASLLDNSRGRGGQPTQYVIRRNGQVLEPMTITPDTVQDPSSPGHPGGPRGVIGVTWRNARAKVGVADGLLLSVRLPWDITKANATELWNKIQTRSTEGFSGPVGIGKVLAEAARNGFRDYMEKLVVLSVALGFFNLLPVPALDGGRLLFLAYEVITRRKPDPKFEAVVHTVFIVMLLAFITLITFRDITS